jgi:uncharacterized membrane protein YeaQ/YmgE (transglycosylase-associated protein family)
MFGEIISAIVVGFLAGLLGRALLPGKQKMGFFATVLLGIVGAFVGYLIFAELLGIGDDDKFDLGGLPGAIIGAMIVLFLYDRFIAGRDEPAAISAPEAGARAPEGDAPAAERGEGRGGRDREARRKERDQRRRER